jgi:predicted TIM-barrel fold metal-dependent hydrolase
MIRIDSHAHILACGEKPGVTEFFKDRARGHLQANGLLPDDRPLSDADWEPILERFGPISPEFCIEDHLRLGIDRVVVLGVSPSEYTAYGIRGTLDPEGATGVPEQHSLDKVNDYMSGLKRKHPDRLICMASVNPRYRGPKAAAAELERAILELHLDGLKLYPGLDQYSPDDRQLAFPVFAKAAELDIPVMIHMGLCPASDPSLRYERPWLLDDVGRHFPNLNVLVCHAGWPWVDECIALLVKHANFWCDLASNHLWTRREMFEFLHRCKRCGVPLSRVCWGNDWPSFEPLESLLQKFVTMNDEAEDCGLPPFSDREMDLMLGGSFLFFAGLSDEGNSAGN